MARFDGNSIVFSTGRVAAPNAGIVGIDQELELTQGYDSEFRMNVGVMVSADGAYDVAAYKWKPGIDEPTSAELVELADLMIGLWQALRAKHAQGKTV